jgi:hypothetical protein
LLRNRSDGVTGSEAFTREERRRMIDAKRSELDRITSESQ